MSNTGKFIFFLASGIVLIVVLSGCVSKTPSQTPTSTATPVATQIQTEVTPVPAIITPFPTASPSVPPAIKVLFYPSGPNGDTNITIRWEVSGGTPGDITQSAIHWGYRSGNASISEYPKVSMIQSGKTPQGFSATIKTPSGGSIYFRAHAMVDGTDVYSTEYQITIVASTGGGGGSGGGGY